MDFSKHFDAALLGFVLTWCAATSYLVAEGLKNTIWLVCDSNIGVSMGEKACVFLFCYLSDITPQLIETSDRIESTVPPIQ